jgi:hypothetical protein
MWTLPSRRKEKIET